MKIIHLVLGKANPERMNGINRIVHELAGAMLTSGMDVEIWGITKDPMAPTPPRHYPLRLYQTVAGGLWLAPELERDLIALGRDARVHLHGALLQQFALISRILRKHKIPYVVTPHGAYSSVALARKSRAKRAYISLIDQHVMRGALAVQVNSQFEADELAERLPGLHTIVIPNGQRVLTMSTSHASGEIEFVYCGRLAQSHKGLDLLIDGFKDYRSFGGNGRLALIGDGPDGDALRERAKPDSEVIDFLGPLYGDDKLCRIAAANVFVHTSRHEGMPMAVLEAAGLGMPLLLSRATNLADSVDKANAGLIVEPNTPNKIARAMMRAEQLHAAGQLARLGQRAQGMIASKFSWEQVGKRMVQEVYQPDNTPRKAA